ncbi:hypothetical protein D918_06514 [Trichuris suis]|nr:hypothetical protein D918_06514 [Trichuris suis]
MTFRKYPVKHAIEVLLALVLSCVLHLDANRARNSLISNTTAEIMHGSVENSSIAYEVPVPLDPSESQIVTTATGDKAEPLKLSPFTNRSESPKSNQGYLRLPTNRSESVEDRFYGIPGKVGMMPFGKPDAQVGRHLFRTLSQEFLADQVVNLQSYLTN